MKRIRTIVLSCALTLSTSAAAHAQTTDAPTQGLTPPTLTQSIEPTYPESKRSSGESAVVTLVLTLDETGHVMEAAVSGSAGAEFDSAALEAAQRLVFEPARRDGKPVAARVPFRFDFTSQAPPAEPALPVVVPPVQSSVVPSAETSSGRARAADAAELDIEVEGDRPPREPTQRSLSAEEITKIPGTNGDALRSIGNMPGVARPPGMDGLLLVRGSSPRDSQVFIDGTNVPLVYHFGGLSSVVPSEILERIDFYPGNFGPQYGRATGGIVDVAIRSPRKDRLGGLLQVDLVDARLVAEGPLGDRTRFLVGARRSYLDAWLGPVLRGAGVGVTAAPVYYDYQAMLEHDVTKDTTLRLFAFGSDDRLALTLNSPDAEDPAFGGDVGLHHGFWRVQGRVDTRPSSSIRWTTTLSLGHDTEDTNVGDMKMDVGTWNVEGRSDVRVKLGPALTAIGGIDIQHEAFDVGFRIPSVDFEGGEPPGPVFGRPLVTLSAKGALTRPGAYAMFEVSPIPSLKIFPGIRADYNSDTENWTADPRLGARWDVHAAFPRTTVKGGAGLFHQPPEPYETVAPFGSAGVKSESALHYSLGFEQELTRPLELSVEGFYKDLNDLVQSLEGAASSASGRSYQNIGQGRSYGTELLLRYKPQGRFFGWVAYTLSRSERRDAPSEAEYRYDYDQTHILTALGSVKLGRGWQLGGRFRYVTGSPYTPNIGGVMDYDAGAYAPVSSPSKNGSRLPAFHQLDVRVDKTWKFNAWSLTAYLDVQNAYNRQNTEGISYNYNYSKTTKTAGLPILPIIGVRGEL